MDETDKRPDGSDFAVLHKPITRLGLIVLVVLFLAGWFLVRFRSGRNLTMTGTSTETLGIPAVINQLESELRGTERDHLLNNQPGLFRVGEVEVELTVVAKASSKVNGGVELEVVKAGSDFEVGHEATHKVTVHLHPR